MGQCVMTLELFQPVVDDMRYACEVSGERPMFRIERLDIDIAALGKIDNMVHDGANENSSVTGYRQTWSGIFATNMLYCEEFLLA